jgi:hypothetical protein
VFPDGVAVSYAGERQSWANRLHHARSVIAQHHRLISRCRDAHAALHVTRVDRDGMDADQQVAPYRQCRIGKLEILQRARIGDRQPVLPVPVR